MAHIQALVPGTVGDAICQGVTVMLARHIVAPFERDAPLPDGGGDRFSGYAIIGLPFQSGHVLALRRFPVSSIGPGYTAVWHRDPSGRWTFYSTVPPEVSCARYFGREVERNVVASADIAWGGSMSFTVFVGSAIRWHVTLGTSLATRLLNAFAGVIPEHAWNRPAVLRLMGVAAGATLGTGRLNLTGLTPNGYRFVGAPRRLWLIESSQAVVDGVSLGPVGPLVDQAALGDFLLPQKGLFAVGRTRFEQSLNREGVYASHTGSGQCPVSTSNAELLREIAGGKAARIGRVGSTERGESRIGHIKTGRWRLKGGDVLRD